MSNKIQKSITLYQYDHCPYCIRVKMMLARKGYLYTEKTLTYDDISTPTGIYGKKVLPFIIKEDGGVLGESLDILSYLDNLDNNPILQSNKLTESVEQAMSEIRPNANKLYKPRMINTDINDFASSAAIEYYENKFANKIGASFASLMEQTDELLPSVQAGLDKISELLPNATNFYKEGFSMADIHLFPSLRNLTVVKELNFADRLKEYLEYQAKHADLKLFF